MSLLPILAPPIRAARLTLRSIYLPNPIYHQLAFAFILLSSTARLLLLIQRLPPNHPSRRKVIKTMLSGIFTFAGGFAIWNIDNIFCEQLRAIREVIGDDLGMLIQGHGFWHLMTGYGSFLIFVSAICTFSTYNLTFRKPRETLTTRPPIVDQGLS